MKIKNLIKEKGRTTKWVASQLGIPYNTMMSYLNNRRTVPKDLEERVRKIV